MDSQDVAGRRCKIERMAPSTIPERGMLIFDGDCAFCSSCVDWATRVLPVMPETVPYQWAPLDELGITEQEASERIWFTERARQYGGHLAIAAVLRHQPAAAFRLLGWLLTVPPWSWLAAVGYTLVSRNRHRLPGGTPACRLPR
jgi:predicted DCC family thiol-disulfide oxidoreductase YuxK